MAYANSRRIVTIASVAVNPSSVINVTIFSPTAPETRENGGDLLDGDRWVDTQSFIESVYYSKTWNYIAKPNFDTQIDGGDASTGDEWGILDLGSAVVDPLEIIYDGGDAVSN